MLFGDKGLAYHVDFSNGSRDYPVEEWTPELAAIKHTVDTVCAIQYYPHGEVGINAHRDKEMKSETKICGLSLGVTRTLSIMRGSKQYQLPLYHGSLYVFNPPTNDYWAHEIPVESEVTLPRLSLTFRNYEIFHPFG